MASISTDARGNRRILFVGADRKRKAIRLGKISTKLAHSICGKVAALNTAQIMRQPPDDEIARWAASLEATLYDKLASVGLVRRRESMLLGPYLDSYIAMRADVKGSTATVYGHTRRCLVEYFGHDRPLREITQGDADAWKIWLAEHEEDRDGQRVTVKLAENTVNRRCGIAKQFFRAAARRKLIIENPFADMRGVGVKANKEREFFVSRETAARALAACPDDQWRLIFALSRYGGLRCPSEHLALRLSDVDLPRGRLNVRSPKTEHHDGKASRTVPIFPELRPYLAAVWDQAEPGDGFLITRYRDNNANLRTQLLRILARAGVDPWPKLFQNLRSTRETELAETFPIHVVCEWIGNSAAVAAKHYLQVTEAHFEEAAQKAAQSGSGSIGMEQAAKLPALGFTDTSRVLPTCTDVHVGDEGLEPTTSTV